MKHPIALRNQSLLFGKTRLWVCAISLGMILGCCAEALPQSATQSEQKLLYKKQSAYNTIFVTENERGLRTLLFEEAGAQQSIVKLGDPDFVELPYAQVMPVGLAFVDRPQRVLIVGLGGGTIPSFLHKHYPQMTIDVVDIDPDVVDVARRFFGFCTDAKLRVSACDGRKFIEQCREPYDMVFLDAYGPDNIPFHLATREFLQSVRRALRPHGVVVSNVWNSACNPLYDSMVRTYLDVLAELYVIDVPDRQNVILVALPHKESLAIDTLASRAAQVSQQQHFPFDLRAFVADGCRLQQPLHAGRILLDSDAPAKPPDK